MSLRPRHSYVSTYCLEPWPEEDRRRAEENTRLLREEILDAGGIPEWMEQVDVEPGPPNCRWGGKR